MYLPHVFSLQSAALHAPEKKKKPSPRLSSSQPARRVVVRRKEKQTRDFCNFLFPPTVLLGTRAPFFLFPSLVVLVFFFHSCGFRFVLEVNILCTPPCYASPAPPLHPRYE
jgi:hypothetical protein